MALYMVLMLFTSAVSYLACVPFANNFDLAEIAEMAEYAHKLGKKVYVTDKFFAHNDEINQSPDYLRGLEAAKVDALS